MGKHAIGGMRSMMIANRNADMRFRKKSYLRNKERADVGRQKKGCGRKRHEDGYEVKHDQKRSNSDS